MRVELTVNGSKRAAEARDGESLLTFLREELGLTGSKNACEQGECGSCSVMLDGALVCSCLVLAAACADKTVEKWTLDGMDRPLLKTRAHFL